MSLETYFEYEKQFKKLSIYGLPKVFWRFKNGKPKFFIEHYDHWTKEYTEEEVEAIEHET